eukprot:UN2395
MRNNIAWRACFQRHAMFRTVCISANTCWSKLHCSNSLFCTLCSRTRAWSNDANCAVIGSPWNSIGRSMHQCCNVPYIGHDVMKTILFDKGATVARSIGTASVVTDVMHRAHFRQCVQQASLQQRKQI